MSVEKNASGYDFRWLKREEFIPLFQKHRPQLFDERDEFNVNAILSQEEVDAGKRLSNRLGDLFRLYLGVYKDGELVGWSWGVQEGFERFYMVNSAVYPDHRRKGLYSEMLKRVVDRAAAEGFQILYSRHTLTNNAVIIPKLKAGFVISGFEVAERFGTLALLMYFTNPERRRLQEIRCGAERLPDDLRKKLSLSARP